MTSFSLLSAANCINAQSIAWLNPSELKWRVSSTATTDIHDGKQYALFHRPLPFSPASAASDPSTKLLSHAAVAFPHALLPGNCHDLDSHQLTCLSCVHQHHQNGFFCVATGKSHTAGAVLHIRLAFYRILCLWSSARKYTPCCNLRIHWVRKWPSIYRDTTSMGRNVSAHICYTIWLALLTPVFRSGKLESTVRPIIICI